MTLNLTMNGNEAVDNRVETGSAALTVAQPPSQVAEGARDPIAARAENIVSTYGEALHQLADS
jgi:hypothetical protein